MSRVRLAIVAILLTSCASAPIRERCRLTAVCAAFPKEARDFAEVDGLLVRRAMEMAESVRGLQHFLGHFYKREFLEELLPRLCDRVEAARSLAANGNRREAGAAYQGLAVASEVMALEVALVQVGDYADEVGDPAGRVSAQLEAYDRDMAPLMAAALGGDRQVLARELRAGAAKHAAWLGRLNAWERDLQLGMERVEIAHKLWDASLAVVAVYEMAGAAAEMAATGPPSALGPVLVEPGGAAVFADRAALAEAIEALRKLIASGAMDTAVVAGLAQMSGASIGPVPAPRPAAMTVPKRIYSAHGLIRPAVERGPFHNFPESFDEEIFEKGRRTVTPNFWKVAKPGLSNDAVMYELRGSVNGVQGTFEIGVRPSVSGDTEVIMHRFFRPDP